MRPGCRLVSCQKQKYDAPYPKCKKCKEQASDDDTKKQIKIMTYSKKLRSLCLDFDTIIKKVVQPNDDNDDCVKQSQLE
jgi:hypothetical protein